MTEFRKAVFAQIDREREYQEALPASRRSPGPKGTAEYLTLLNTYVRRAQDAWCSAAGDATALHEVRKVAAIAVACLEENGCPARTEVPHIGR